jgi:hypothetical protein
MNKLSAILFSLIILFSCSMPGNDPEPPEYYVSFYIDGQQHLLDKGFTDFEQVPFAGSWGATWTDLFAASGSGTFNDYSNMLFEEDLNILIEDWFLQDTPEVGGNIGEILSCPFTYHDSDISDLVFTGFGNVTIGTNEGCGGVIEGIFSGTVNDGGNTLLLENGAFRVQRIDHNFTF